MFRRVLTSLFILVLTLALTLGAAAASNLEAVSAYINRGLTIKLDGEDIGPMFDVLGAEVFPITYNGTTYLPLRATAELLGVDVDYDEESRTVLLGASEPGGDLIDDLTPYAGSYDQSSGIVLSSDGKAKTIAGSSRDHWIYFNNSEYFYYDLGANYSTLKMTVYCPQSRLNDRFELYVYGDGEPLGEYMVREMALPQEIELDVTGVRELYICGATPDGGSKSSELYIFDASLGA